MKPWMTCEGEYQSERCCEFSELTTTPCQSLTLPHLQIGVRPMKSSTSAAEAMTPRVIVRCFGVIRTEQKLCRRRRLQRNPSPLVGRGSGGGVPPLHPA